MQNDIDVLILSCDKNYDLFPFINKTCEAFINCGCKCTLVTETLGENYSKSINVILTENKNFDFRFKKGLESCESKYVLVLLDDYYVHDDNLLEKIKHWNKTLDTYNLSALRITKLKKKFLKKKSLDKSFTLLTNPRPYEIDFHPTIWDKESLTKLISDRSFSPWSLEPLFSLFLKDKKCGYSKIRIDYNELIIRGCFFKKAFKKYCKELYVGNKKIYPSLKEFSFNFKGFIFNILPYPIINFLRKIFRIKSISSEAKL